MYVHEFHFVLRCHTDFSLTCEIIPFCRAGAVSSGRFVLPDGVGFEINAENNYFILDSHYNNPELARNAGDISGAKMYFANDRPIQAGVMVVGDSRITLIGQRVQHDVEYTSTCSSKCTATWKREVNVFMSFLHMHTTGRKISTNHYSKNGTLIQTLNSVRLFCCFLFLLRQSLTCVRFAFSTDRILEQ